MNMRIQTKSMTQTGGADDGDLLTKALDKRDEAIITKLTGIETKAKETEALVMEMAQKTTRGGLGGGPLMPTTWGAEFTKSDEFKALSTTSRAGYKARVEVKAAATITGETGSGGALVTPDRQSDPTMLVQRRLTIRDLLAPGQTESSLIEVPRQTVRQNNAAIQGIQGSLKPQSDAQFVMDTFPVRTIAHWMLASRQVLDDAPQLATIIDGELRYGLKEVEDMQLLMGSGTGTDLNGVYTAATLFVAPITIAGGTMIDQLRLAILQVRLAGYPATGIVVHPTDLARMELLKDADGRYLIVTVNGQPTLWNLPVVETEAMTVDKFLVGAFGLAAQIFDREEASVEASTEDADNFRRNLVTLLAEERLALVIRRPTALVKGDFGNVT